MYSGKPRAAHSVLFNRLVSIVFSFISSILLILHSTYWPKYLILYELVSTGDCHLHGPCN